MNPEALKRQLFGEGELLLALPMQALANDDQDDYKRHAIPPLAVGVFTVERHVLVEAACGKFQARVTELLGHDVLHADEASVAMLRLGQGNGRALKSH